MQFRLAVLDAVPLELCGAGLVLAENLYEGARREPECGCGGFGIAVLCSHDIEDMGDEQRELRVARLDMPVAARKFHLDCGRFFADIQCQCHLHAVESMNLVLFGASTLGRLYF